MRRIKKTLTAIATFAFIGLAAEISNAQSTIPISGEELHAALHIRYSKENTVRTWYEIFKEESGENVSRETYEDLHFCDDPFRLSYINWIIPTNSVPLIVKLHVLEGMRDAEDELQCFVGS